MGSRGSSTIDISNYNVENKKWDKREQKNLTNALTFMTKHFGDISDLTGKIMKRSNLRAGANGLYDRDNYHGRGRAIYIDTGDYADENVLVHELTHAVTEEIFSNYEQFGYKSPVEFAGAMRTEVYNKLNRPEPKYDARKWSDRPREYFSIIMGSIADNKLDGSKINKEQLTTLNTIKKYWKKVR